MGISDNKNDSARNTMDAIPNNDYRHLKGIIFDMDNTLLQSKINFQAMKEETYSFFVAQEILPAGLPLHEHTTSTIIEEAAATNQMTDELWQAMWEIPEKHEVAGMQGAVLEPGVLDLLKNLHGNYYLAVVTNNSVKAANAALLDNGIAHYFDSIAGREQMRSLKPAPDGFIYTLERYPNTSAKEWLSIGDSWIDGKASEGAGIAFIAYRADVDKMEQAEIFPRKYLNDIRELEKLLN